jgi:hypothetical protein
MPTKFKVGQKVKSIANRSGCCHGVGKVFRISSVQPNNAVANNVYYLEDACYYYESDLVAVGYRRPDLENEKLELLTRLSLVKDLLALLDEVQADELGEDEARAYAVLKVVEHKDLSRIEKARHIASLLQN